MLSEDFLFYIASLTNFVIASRFLMNLLFTCSLFLNKAKFIFVMQFYQKFERKNRILVGVIFLKILEFSKYKNMNSVYNSRNLYEIFRKFLKFFENFDFNKKIQVLSRKFKMQLPSKILVFPEFLIKLQCKKKFDCTCFLLVLRSI